MNNKEMETIRRVLQTLKEMLCDRGYSEKSIDVSFRAAEGAMSREDLVLVVDKRLAPPFKRFAPGAGDNSSSSLQPSSSLLSSSATPVSSRLLVVFPVEPKVGVKPMRDIGVQMDALGARRAIVVVKEGIGSTAKPVLAELTRRKQRIIEVFAENSLLVNITRNELVPSHRLLSRDEKADVLQRYRCTESDLPRMLTTDPVARYYGLSRGQVCEIVRPSETGGLYYSYRIVA